MTVAELIEKLEEMPQDAPVLIVCDEFDAEPSLVEAGTDGDNNPCCWLITTSVP